MRSTVEKSRHTRKRDTRGQGPNRQSHRARSRVRRHGLFVDFFKKNLILILIFMVYHHTWPLLPRNFGVVASVVEFVLAFTAFATFPSSPTNQNARTRHLLSRNLTLFPRNWGMVASVVEFVLFSPYRPSKRRIFIVRRTNETFAV